MNLDDILTRSAHEVASQARVPVMPDPMKLRDRALHARRRRRAAAVAAVAAAVAAALTVPSLTSRSAEPATPPVPAQAPAWADSEGVLHIGTDLEIETGVEVRAFTTTRDGVAWTSAKEDGAWWRPFDGEPVQVTSDHVDVLSGDPDSDVLVWVNSSDEGEPAWMAGTDVVAYDVGARTEIARTYFPVRGRQFASRTIRESAQLLVVLDSRTMLRIGNKSVWWSYLESRPFGADLDLGTLDTTESWMAVTYGDEGFDFERRRTGATQLTRVAFSNGFSRFVHSRGPRVYDAAATFSPDGRYFLGATSDDGGPVPVLFDVTSGRRLPLGLPESAHAAAFGAWGWGLGHTLMIDLTNEAADANDSGWWTCEASTGECERFVEDVAKLPQ